MEEQTRKKQLEERLTSTLKRMDTCTDPKLYLELAKASSELSKQIEDIEKLESEKNDKKHKFVKDFCLATIPLAVVEFFKYIFLEQHTKRVITFEEEGIWSTGAGKNVSQTTKFK